MTVGTQILTADAHTLFTNLAEDLPCSIKGLFSRFEAFFEGFALFHSIMMTLDSSYQHLRVKALIFAPEVIFFRLSA